MPDTSKTPGTPKPQDATKDSETSADKKLDRVADELAKRGQKAEQRYDESHGAFRKFGGS